MQLKLVTGFHLCLAGEAFWLLDKRPKVKGALTSIDILLPTGVHERIINTETLAGLRPENDRLTLDEMLD